MVRVNEHEEPACHRYCALYYLVKDREVMQRLCWECLTSKGESCQEDMKNEQQTLCVRG